MPTRALVCCLLALATGVAACGGDDGGAVPDPTTSTSTTEITTTTATGPSTTAEEAEGPGCPDPAAIPATATEVATAPVAYDGDGDGVADTLSTFFHDDLWWVHAEWASGGTSAVAIDDVGGLGARPIGGHDVDGDGVDEAFVSISGPASGSIVALFHTDGCDLVPVVDDTSGLAFSFPVTASIGTFSGASCHGVGHLDLYSGELVDADAGEYLVGVAPHRFTDGRMVAEPGDAGSVDLDDVARYSSLDCGRLASGL